MELELLGGSFVWATSFIPHNDTRKKEEEREKKRYRRKLSGPRYTIHPLCGGNCFLLSKGAKGNFNLAILPWNAMRFHFSLHSQPIQRLLFDYSTKKQKKNKKQNNVSIYTLLNQQTITFSYVMHIQVFQESFKLSLERFRRGES